MGIHAREIGVDHDIGYDSGLVLRHLFCHQQSNTEFPKFRCGNNRHGYS